MRYGNKVRITKGFYKDCVGILVDCNDEVNILYDVEITKIARKKVITIRSEHLELLEEIKKK